MIYFDTAATSRVSDKVIDDITWCLQNVQGNPSSLHSEGHKAKTILEKSRKKVADYIGAEADEIIFTASGSEANNLAIQGFLKANDLYDCILTTEIEHPSVYNTCKKYEDTHKVVYIPLESNGRVKLNRFHQLISELSHNHYCFASVMMANNEIGTVQPIQDIAREIHRLCGTVHVDATQAIGNIPVNVKELGVDLLTFSAHKLGLPRGIGILYKKKGIKLEPIVYGGHQEQGLVAGTENVAMIYALGNQLKRMKDKKFPNTEMLNYLTCEIDDICNESGIKLGMNGSVVDRLPNILSLTFNGINAESLITLLDIDGVCISAGSACSSGIKEPSRILKAIGLSDEAANSTVRISIGHDTTSEECDEFARLLKKNLITLQLFNH